MALAEIARFPDTVTLIPGTGIQFLDFAFNLADVDGRKNPKAPSDWGFYDPRGSGLGSTVQIPVMLRRGEDQLTPGREDYAIDMKRVLQLIERKWVPLPLLREEPGQRFFQGPINWARAYLVHIPERDRAGFEYRLVFAIDTSLMVPHPSGGYLAPSPDDARNGRRFGLPPRGEFYNFFLQQPWVRGWLNDAFKLMVELEEKKKIGRREATLTDDDLVERMDGPNEALARYMAFIDLLYQLDFLPRITLTDTITSGRGTAIDVDMVLDLGNSRTCGLLVEAEPDSRGADINRAFKLELRDLTHPEHVYSDPFESRIEFALAHFGPELHSHRSGRADAFTWPTIVRVGPEAVRLAATRRGSEGRTGMSSPKRYLWDDEPSQQSWRFNGQTIDGEWEGFAAQGVFAGFVNDAGQPIHQAGPMDDNLPTLLARYSRSNLVSFLLAEVLLQALTMMNAPAQRLKRRNADLPRRLRRIILTMPTALSLAERQILKERAEAARDLVYLSLGLAEVAPATETGPGGLVFKTQRAPEIVLKYDEASATQVVYLYSELALAFSGDARAFIEAVRGGPDKGNPDELRIATLDIGGGTTDLVVTALDVQGQGANVTIFPIQLFRESFSVAGDDIVQALAREKVVGAFATAAEAAIGRPRTDALLQSLFGGNRGDMTAEEALRRQQFATQIASPVAVQLLAAYEHYDPLHAVGPEYRPLRSFFEPGFEPSPDLVRAIERRARDAGFSELDLLELPIEIDLGDVDRVIRAVLGDVMRAMTEVAWRYGTDLILLSGRPSRFPVIKHMVLETGAFAPHRVLAMHEFRVGQWYPFRDREARINDPKTTAAVGGMICLLAEGHLHNFNFRSDRLMARSVARYLGKIEVGNRLKAADVYYADVNLEDPEYQLPEISFDFRGPMALGVRQFPNDWWPATLLYTIDYASEEARQRLQPRTPLKVQLVRERVPRGNKPKEGEAPEVNDRLAIANISTTQGNVGKQALRLQLQTLRNRDGYWLDTGILVDI